jgi:polygalacturonase
MKLNISRPFCRPFQLSAALFLTWVTATFAVPALPNINTNTIVNITNSSFGAVSSTTLTNTTAIQNAINFASTTNGGAGCTVQIPAGTYLSGPLTLKSHVNLQIDTNATLKMLPYAKWSGTTTFINGSSISDVMISGTGTIDGQGWDWWVADTNSSISRPNFINFTGSSRILIEGVTLTNPPTFHLMLKGDNKDITIQSIIINTLASPNTDGMDLGSSNILVRNCYISCGDDNIEIGGSSGKVADLTVTNCHFGIGHGVSIGSYCQAGISNVTVVDCTFTNTDYVIRMKSDYDRGGIVQNLFYGNITNSGIKYAPIVIYSYYNLGGNPTIYKVTPELAAATNAITATTTTPTWRNILISNLVGTAAQPGMIWGRTERPATNIVLCKLDITATGSYQNFEIYNAKQIKIVDSKFKLNASTYTNFWLYNAEVTFTNTAYNTNLISLYGVTTNSYSSILAFYNGRATLRNTNLVDDGPLTIGDSTLTISNNFALIPSTVLNYVLDSNTNQVAVVGNLAMGGTINVTTNASGFTAGTNTIFTYTGTLSGALPALGSTPGGSYTYSLITNTTTKQVSLVVASTGSPTPTTSTLQSSANPSTYGSVVTFTNTVNPAPPNGENITFKDGSTTLGTGTLSSGQATYTTTATQLAAGSHSITAVYAGDGTYGASTSSIVSQTVNARSLTVSGLTVNSKIYDRTTGTSLSTNGYTLNTVVGSDVVTLATNGSTVTFASSNVANGISVTVSGLTLSGAQAGNYTLTQPTGLTGNITALGLTVSSLTANSKVYDRTPGTSLNTNGYSLNTVIGGDVVTLATNGSTATFASSNVANNISITVAGLSLGGAQAGNYTLTQPAGLMANITPLGLTVSGLTISNKVYDGTTVATLNTNGYTLNTVIGGDVVTLVTNGYTATFASSNVANGIGVTVTNLSLGGAQAGNYTLTQPAGLTGNIMPLGLTVSGLTVNNKVYDGTTAAALNTNGYVLNTVIGSDVVTLVTNGYTATFASSNVANGISVTVTNLSLGGVQAGNYTLAQPTGLTGNITPASSSIVVNSSASPIAHLSPVSFTANVTPSSQSGTVLFLTNGMAFDSQTLSGGAATSVSTSILPRGTNTITAQYSGNGNYSPSTNTLNQTVTNNPPAANPALYYRLAGSSLTIVIASLATNWNDLDGDTLVLAGVSSPSTNGGTVTFDSTKIYYTDANDVTDRFGYMISDGHGGTNSSIVTVLVAQQEVSGITNSNGGVTLDFTGIPGSTYWVMAATNLTAPDWTPISTNVAGTNGFWQFTDTQATNFLDRYYRTQSGP